MAKSTSENPSGGPTPDRETPAETTEAPTLGSQPTEEVLARGEGVAPGLVEPVKGQDITGAVFVEYVGYADIVRISAADFKRIGIDDQTMIEFDTRVWNGNRLRIADLSAGALDYLNRGDARFRFVDAAGKPVKAA